VRIDANDETENIWFAVTIDDRRSWFSFALIRSIRGGIFPQAKKS
jgi:hypothetical protein